MRVELIRELRGRTQNTQQGKEQPPDTDFMWVEEGEFFALEQAEEPQLLQSDQQHEPVCDRISEELRPTAAKLTISVSGGELTPTEALGNFECVRFARYLCGTRNTQVHQQNIWMTPERGVWRGGRPTDMRWAPVMYRGVKLPFRPAVPPECGPHLSPDPVLLTCVAQLFQTGLAVRYQWQPDCQQVPRFCTEANE